MSTALVIVIVVVVLVALTAGGIVMGRAVLKRQRRIWQMKRFRRDARGKRVELSDDEKKTIAV